MTDLLLVRRGFTDVATEGDLYVNGRIECHTLEDTVRAPGVKVWGKTSIPFGRFRVGVHASPRFGRDLPHLLAVPNFSHILIHAGNSAKDTEGCILVGRGQTALTDDWIATSRPAETAVTKLVKRALDEGEVRISVVGPLLQRGSKGDGVRVLQLWLRMPIEQQDGDFGPVTERAVMTLQGLHGLPITGVADVRTWTKLT